MIFKVPLLFAQNISTNAQLEEDLPIQNKKNSKPKIEKQEEFDLFDLPKIDWVEKTATKYEEGGDLHLYLKGKVEPGYILGIRKYLEKVSTDGKLKNKLIQVQNQRVKGEKIIYFDKSKNELNLHIRLQPGNYKIPIVFKKGNGVIRYWIVVSVKEGEVLIENGSLFFSNDCSYCVWLGAGMHIVSYQQEPPQNVSEVNYLSSAQPDFSLRGRFQIHGNWKLRLGVSVLPAQELTSKNMTFLNNKMSWMQTSAEADYRLAEPFMFLGLRFDPALLVGFQYHDMPFLDFVESRTFTVNNLKLLTLSAGGMLFVNLHNRLYYEIYMRLQSAISGQGDIQAQGGFAFDGSVGAIYRLNRKLRLAGFWGGQYHSYPYTSQGAKGSYQLVNSKLDLNIGYEF